MFTIHNTFKNDFTYTIRTDSFKYDSSECRKLIDEALAVYSNDTLNFKKVFVSAVSLNAFAQAAIKLAAEGYSILEKERSHSASVGNYAIRFVKPHSLQAEDKSWIEKLVQDAYIDFVEKNAVTYKAKLKAALIAEEKAKEAAKQEEAEAKRQAKLEAETNKKFEQLLQEQGI